MRLGAQKEERALANEQKEVAKKKLIEDKKAAREQQQKEKEDRLRPKQQEEASKSAEAKRRQSLLLRLSGFSSGATAGDAAHAAPLSGTEGGEDDKSSKASGSELAYAQLFGATAADRARAKRAAEDKEQRRLTAAGEALAAKEGASAARQAGWRAEEAARAEERWLERAKAEAEAVDAGERRRLRDAEADQARLEQANVQDDRHHLPSCLGPACCTCPLTSNLYFHGCVFCARVARLKALAAAEAAAAEAEALARAKERERLEQQLKDAELRASIARAAEAEARLPTKLGAKMAAKHAARVSRGEEPPTKGVRRRAPGQREAAPALPDEVGEDGMTPGERERWEAAAAEQEAARQRRIQERAARDKADRDREVYGEGW
jgi:hypothetical protein